MRLSPRFDERVSFPDDDRDTAPAALGSCWEARRGRRERGDRIFLFESENASRMVCSKHYEQQNNAHSNERRFSLECVNPADTRWTRVA